MTRDQLVKLFDNFTTGFEIMGSDKGVKFAWEHTIQIFDLRNGHKLTMNLRQQRVPISKKKILDVLKRQKTNAT